MKCPLGTNTDLIRSHRQGMEIDYCPTCRGIWLARRDLDKIMECSAPNLPAPQSRQESLEWHQGEDNHHRYRYKKYSG